MIVRVRTLQLLVAVVAVVGTLLASACTQNAPSDHEIVDGDAEPLRSAFNADSGKVRAIFLASPT